MHHQNIWIPEFTIEDHHFARGYASWLWIYTNQLANYHYLSPTIVKNYQTFINMCWTTLAFVNYSQLPSTIIDIVVEFSSLVDP